MRHTDFTDYKFRCSSIGKLMTNSRSKSNPLSVTTMNYLKQLHKEEVFGRKKEIRSKYLDKGIEVEEEAITLYSEVTGELFIKNKKRFTNDFITEIKSKMMIFKQGKYQEYLIYLKQLYNEEIS